MPNSPYPKQMEVESMSKLTMKNKQALAGWMFVMPWLVGLVLFFIQPVANFLIYSFNQFNMGQGGYSLSPLSNPFQHYIDAWTADVIYPVRFVEAFEHFLYAVPIIVVFSLFCAILLNQDFKGRGLMRAVFFLPVITTSGVFGLITTRGMSMGGAEATATTDSTMFDITLLTDFLIESGIPSTLVESLSSAVSNVAGLIWNSGVQILIFLIGLLAIPESYYEAAKVEGATGWETFWKITFPVVSPFILANLVYTLITECMATSNGVILYVTDLVERYRYDTASAMMWMYFLATLIVVAIIYGIGSKLMVSSR